jgi:thioredoxin 1
MKTTEKLWAVGLVALVVAVPLALKHRSSAARQESARPDTSTTCPGGAVSSNGVCGPAANAAASSATVAARPLPKLLDLGTRTCAPCKAMLTVLDELERGYPEQLAVEFINVQENETAAEKWTVDVIPTQVFLGSDGREVYRHVGFISTDAIVKKWGELGYALTRNPNAH